VEGFSEALLQEVEEYNIRVKLIEPGTIKTNFFKNVVRVPSAAKAYEKRYTNFIDKILIKGEQGESPVMVAERVYKAATSKNGFRYLVDFSSKLLVTMHIINPFFVFRKIIKKAIG
jgi:short-subunit dehydrogenase